MRIDLAAACRLFAAYGMSDLVSTHTRIRFPGPDHHLLITSCGLMLEEIAASSLVKVDQTCNKLSDASFPVNPAGFTIHSAIHQARADVGYVLHTHTNASANTRTRTRTRTRAGVGVRAIQPWLGRREPHWSDNTIYCRADLLPHGRQAAVAAQAASCCKA